MADTNIINDYIAGAIGGMAGLIVGHPFDTTKVQLQTKQTGSSAYKGSFDAMKNISKYGMAHGFFRGLGFPLASYGVVNSVFFGMYGSTLKYLKGSDTRKSSYKEVYIAGCVGGFAQLFVACPVDVVKVVLQSQMSKSAAMSITGTPYFHGPLDCTRWLIKHKGLTSLYRGLGVMTLRDVPTYGVYTIVYEYLMDTLTSRGLSDKHGISANLLAGGTAGVCCWALIIPFDVVKSLMQSDASQTKYTSMLDCAAKTYRMCGIKAFWTGLTVTCLRAFPVNAVTFLFYSKCLQFLNSNTQSEVS